MVIVRLPCLVNKFAVFVFVAFVYNISPIASIFVLPIFNGHWVTETMHLYAVLRALVSIDDAGVETPPFSEYKRYMGSEAAGSEGVFVQ